jgi:hypothetical protein
MKLKVLLLGVVVAAFSFSAFAGTGAYSLKPSAAGNLNGSADTTVTTIAYVDSTTAPISPRALANQGRIVQGAANDQDSMMGCRQNMVASPKAVAECAAHATMPGCAKLATVK